MDNVTFITEEGLLKLKKELEHLKTVERLNVAKMIGEAKSYGDLRENSEYDAAKTKEAQVEAKIKELEYEIKNSVIISSDNIDTSKVSVGCTVTLYDNEFDEEVVYKIVGASESDPVNGLISNESPVGKQLLGKRVKDIVEITTPGGVCSYKVLKISA